MFSQLLPALRIMIFMTVLTGLIYPAVVTGICQLLFRDKANGSMVATNGTVVGSSLIGQNFKDAKYFQPRPSAAGTGYDGLASGGSNLGPTSQKLSDRVKTSVAKFKAENPGFDGPIPADLVTASASGLDPHLSPASAMAQVARVAKVRSLPEDKVRQLVTSQIENREFGILGEPRVNVLALNIALDQAALDQAGR